MGNSENIRSLRVLIAAGDAGTVPLLRQVFSVLGVTKVASATQGDRVMQMLKREPYDAVFIDDAIAGPEDGASLISAMRESATRTASVPAFFVSSGLKRSDIEQARQSGFTDVIVKPVSAATMQRKLEAVARRA